MPAGVLLTVPDVVPSFTTDTANPPAGLAHASFE
jgi:hypothetical protein